MVAAIYELVDQQTHLGQQVLNVYHYYNSAGTGSPATLVTDYVANVLVWIKSAQSPNTSHVSIRTRLIYPTAALGVDTAITPVVGTGSGDDLASCDALSIKFLLATTNVLTGGFTGHIKRSGTRIGVPTEAMVNGNSCASGTISVINSWFPQLQDPVGDGTFQLCCASFLDGAHPRVRHATVQAYALINGRSDPAPSTQNTRKVLRGRTF